MANELELTKFTLDGTELEIVDNTARSSASSAQSSADTALSNANTACTKATDALNKANVNASSITTIKSTKVVKTAVYSNTTKTLAITTGNIW